LLLPALSYLHVTRANPAFDVRATPSNVGIIPETFRLMPGVMRSVHPTHSVCGIGPLAVEILEPHIQDSTPCGLFSPFHILPRLKGQILMLGCGLEPNTSMHAIEELIVPPYLFSPPIQYHLTLSNGQVVEKTYTPHNFNGYAQRYDRVEHILSAPALRTGMVLAAQAHLIEATALWEAVLDALRRDPLAFVDKVA
jgi:aminoglycoside 3-N-acetyltransferase